MWADWVAQKNRSLLTSVTVEALRYYGLQIIELMNIVIIIN